MKKVRIHRRIFLAILLLSAGFSSLPARAQNSPPQGGNVSASPDYAVARRDIFNLEAVINDVINTTFSNPFGLVQKPKGVYLQGYGVMFSFLINIHRGMISTPFGEFRDKRAISPDQKKQRIEGLKEKLVEILVNQGGNFRQLQNSDRISIVAFFEDRNFPDEESQNKTIILSVLKSDLESAADHGDQVSKNELRQKVKIVEY